MKTKDILEAAKAAAPKLRTYSDNEINAALSSMADSLVFSTEEILSANAEDVAAAREKMNGVMIDRLALNEERIRGMADEILQVAKLPSPVGTVLDRV